MKYFNITSTLNLFSGQYRNHRKVLLIDGEEALTGGRNIGDEYFDLREDFNFLDRDIKVKGTIVTHIQNTFEDVWNSSASQEILRDKMPEITDAKYIQQERSDIDEPRFKNDLNLWKKKVRVAQEFLLQRNELLEDEIRIKGKQELDKEYKGVCDSLSFNSEFPIIGKKNRSERIIKHDLSERISKAKESILFDSPYFIVNDESKKALEVALRNKTKVKLLTNSLNSTDAIYVYAAFDSIIKSWIDKGLETHIYKGSIPQDYPIVSEAVASARFGVHAKSFVFDNKDVVIGTFNFDPRSANLNTEMTIACENNPDLAKVVTEDIEKRIKNSIHLDSNTTVDDVEFYNVGFFKKLQYYILKVPSNIFDYLL